MSKAAIEISKQDSVQGDQPLRRNPVQRAARQQRQAVRDQVRLSDGANHSIFGRYIDTFERRLPTLSRTGNPLAVRREFGANKDARAQSTALGDTLVLGANMVNSFRFTWNDTRNSLNDPPDKFFDAPELGIKLHTYVPGTLALAVTDGFTISGGNSVDGESSQRGVPGGGRRDAGARPAPDRARREPGVLEVRFVGLRPHERHLHFNGQATGRGLTDFLTGQARRCEHGAPNTLHMTQWYLGVFAQDAWRATDRLTLNVGLRWEPYFGQNITNGAVSNFVLENFRQGIKTKRFTNAPAGHHLSRRSRVPRRPQGHEQPVGEPLASRGGGLGRHGRRTHGGAVVVRMAYDFPDRIVHVQAGDRIAVQQPPPD